MDTDWYFAFGANMSSAVFEKRRGMSPLRAERAVVRGWERAYVERGFRPIEPVFAGLVERPEGECWGVAFELQGDDATRLDRFEGSGYCRVRVTAECETFGPQNAFAYASSRPVEGRKPSRRYLSLLLDGAREHGLPEHVIEALEAEPSTHIPVLSAAVPAFARLVEALARRRR